MQVRQARQHRPLKLFINQLVLTWVSSKVLLTHAQSLEKHIAQFPCNAQCNGTVRNTLNIHVHSRQQEEGSSRISKRFLTSALTGPRDATLCVTPVVVLCALQHSLQLDQKYKLPKTRCFGGDPRPQRIRKDPSQPPLVAEIPSAAPLSDEEPSFALRTSKAKLQPKRPSQARQTV